MEAGGLVANPLEHFWHRRPSLLPHGLKAIAIPEQFLHIVIILLQLTHEPETLLLLESVDKALVLVL